jgi:hypothetical protein
MAEQWVNKYIELNMGQGVPSAFVHAECYGDLAMHKQGDTWSIVHWPSGRWIVTSYRAKRFVAATLKRMAPLFNGMPDKQNPDGDDPAYKSWFDSVKQDIFKERNKIIN